MSKSRTIWIVLASLAAMVAGVGLSLWLLYPCFETWGVSVHMKSVTKELAQCGQEYSLISTDESAIRAVEMLGYMSRYYVPGPGYRGPAEIEAALEAQRWESMQQVITALEKYSRHNYGTDLKRWADWAENQRNHPKTNQ